MSNHELCSTCIPYNKCLFEEAIEGLKPDEVTPAMVVEYKLFAGKLNCPKTNEADRIVRGRQLLK